MKKLTSQKNLITGAFISSALVGILIACGPSYIPRLLDKKNTIIATPIRSSELIFPDNKKQYQHNKHLHQLPVRMRDTLNTDLDDLKKAVPDLAEGILDRYKAIRTDMLVTQWNSSANTLNKNKKPKLNWLDEDVLAALPKEFSIYLRGAIAYRTGNSNEARKHWKAILDLPKTERKHRSIWSAWMLARTSEVSRTGEAMQWYDKVKQLKNAGFPDSLEVTTRDWTAYFSQRSGDYLTALNIYFKEGRENITSPIETLDHINHVFHLADTHLKDDQNTKRPFLQALAVKKEFSLAYTHFITAENIAGIVENPIPAWVSILESSQRSNIDTELGICAVKAHKIKDEKTLQACLNAMKNPTIESLWLNAQLEALNGRLAEAAELYESAIALFHSQVSRPKGIYLNDFAYPETGYKAESNYFSLYSEYASVELGRKNHSKALDLFITADADSNDAAYIAETLLTPSELLTYYRDSEIAQESTFIKDILKRKLMRNEYFKDAGKLVLKKELNNYQSYCYAYRIAIDEKQTIEIRVEAYEEAASIVARHSSSSLFDLENGCRPFVRVHTAGVSMHERYDYSDHYKRIYLENTPYIPAMTDDELNRIKKHYIRISPINTKKLHLAELYYRAAMLLPKGNNQAAELFWKAGNLTRIDSQVADKYYQALIRRCNNTKLAKACDEIRWFIKPQDLATLKRQL